MSVDTVTSESLKEKAKVISKFMKEKYHVDVPHGHSLDLISRLSGFNGWNAASAALGPRAGIPTLPFKIKTVADMKAALTHFKDSDIVDAMYDFKLEHYLEESDDIDPNGDISQEFSLVLEAVDDSKHEIRFASFKLKLENEDVPIKF